MSTARGFTLVEALVSVVVMGILAAVIAPAISSATDAQSSVSELKRSALDAGYAMDRIVRLIRDIPLNGVDLAATGNATSLTLTDGRGLRITGSTLEYVEAGQAYPLCTDVTDFRLAYVAADGLTTTTAPLCQRIHVSLTSGEARLTGAALPRVRMTP